MPELASLDPKLTSQLDTLRSGGAQMHHVVDLKAGKVTSTSLTKAPTTATRKKLLKLAGHVLDSLVFDSPKYRVSSRNPFLASPGYFTTVSSAVTYLTQTEEIAWSQARNPSGRGSILFRFDDPPRGQCLATFSFSAFPHSGTTGSVTLRAGSASRSIPVTGPAAHTAEVIFDAPATGVVDVRLVVEKGVQILAFRRMTLGLAPPVILADV